MTEGLRRQQGRPTPGGQVRRPAFGDVYANPVVVNGTDMTVTELVGRSSVPTAR